MTAIEVQNKIKQYEDTINRAKMMVVRAETQMQSLEQEKEKILAELAQHGITELTLPDEIARLSGVVASDIEKMDVWLTELKAVLG